VPKRTLSTAERFWEKVDKSGGCWEWTAYKRQGYGRFSMPGGPVLAHRLAWLMLIGPIPAGLVLDHLCRNPGCVNPAHLEPVTPGVNVMRGTGPIAANATKTHCPAGHPYDRISAKRRECRTCDRDRHRAARGGWQGRVYDEVRSHCIHGHEYTPENTRIASDGGQRCRACDREHQRRYRLRLKEAAT
jgi:hypothetical protein